MTCGKGVKEFPGEHRMNEMCEGDAKKYRKIVDDVEREKACIQVMIDIADILLMQKNQLRYISYILAAMVGVLFWIFVMVIK